VSQKLGIFCLNDYKEKLLTHPTLDGNGVKAMPGRFKYPILVHSIQYLKRKKIQVAKWGGTHSKKSYKF